VSSVCYGQKHHHSLNSKSGCHLKEVTAESMTESSSQLSSLSCLCLQIQQGIFIKDEEQIISKERKMMVLTWAQWFVPASP
jgi:hypothetical protein